MLVKGPLAASHIMKRNACPFRVESKVNVYLKHLQLSMKESLLSADAVVPTCPTGLFTVNCNTGYCPCKSPDRKEIFLSFSV